MLKVAILCEVNTFIFSYSVAIFLLSAFILCLFLFC